MSILKDVKPFPPDPIFGLASLFKKDERERKVDLTVGVYHNAKLQTETMRSVKEAEKKLFETEKNKAYLPMGGSKEFVAASRLLVFGESTLKTHGERLSGVQTLGGTGALRIGGELLAKEVSQTLFLSDPTWPNHVGVFKSSQMELQRYPYYDENTCEVAFDQMFETLAKAKENSIVVLHAVCHNPTGCDMSQDQWKKLSALMLEKKLVPFFDFAYQGFSKGIEEDAWAIRYFAKEGHELFVAHSFSKFFGLYGERVGALHMLVKDPQTAENIFSVAKRITRVSVSNPPRHGAGLVVTVMQDKALQAMWQSELEEMRSRIAEMRETLANALAEKFGEEKFGFLKNRRGLFSMLGLKNEIVDRLIHDFGVYLTQSGRINLTGLNRQNIGYVVEAIVKTLS